MSFNTRTVPVADMVPVTPSDTVVFNPLPLGIYVGVGGDVALTGSGPQAQNVVLKNVPSGTTLNIAARAVRATGTTATSIVALYSALAYRPLYTPPTPALPVGIPDPELPLEGAVPANALTTADGNDTLFSPIDGQLLTGLN